MRVKSIITFLACELFTRPPIYTFKVFFTLNSNPSHIMVFQERFTNEKLKEVYEHARQQFLLCCKENNPLTYMEIFEALKTFKHWHETGVKFDNHLTKG